MQSKKSYWHLLGSILLTGLLVFAIAREQSFSEFAKLFTQVDRGGVLLYFAISVSAIFLRASRYQFIIRDAVEPEPVPGYGQMLIVTIIRNGFVDLLPARLGEASFLYVCTRYGVPLLTAAGAFGVCLVLDVIVLFGLFMLLGVLDQTIQVFGDSQTLALGLLGVLVVVLGAILYQLDRFIEFVADLLGRLPVRKPGTLATVLGKLREWATQVVHDLRSLKGKRRYPILVLLTIGLRVAKYGSLYILLVATISQFGYGYSDVSPLLSSTAFVAAEASASLPISGLMGFGAYEVAWSTIFSVNNLEIPSITSVILVVHIITQVVGYSFALLGIALFLVHEFVRRKD